MTNFKTDDYLTPFKMLLRQGVPTDHLIKLLADHIRALELLPKEVEHRDACIAAAKEFLQEIKDMELGD